MKIILNELERIEKLFSELPGLKDHRKKEYKDDLEWWILGRFKKILENEGLKFPNYAEKLLQNDTDFVVSFDGSHKYKCIQITECVQVDLKRGKLEKNTDIWKEYENVLMKKLNYDFGPDNWLLIYFDNSYFQISSNGSWHKAILQRSLKFDMSSCKYEKVIAIDARGNAAVELYPFSFVICPEWRNKSTIVDQCLYRKDSYYKMIK
jgi:hypothetical protein